MKAFNGIMKTIGILISVFTAILIGIMLVYSGYVLYDNYYKGQVAFSSRELAQYRPDPEKDPKIEFKKLKKLNKDAVGWIQVFDTHIDYPIMQGSDNIEYVNKDPRGQSSLTGSIFLEAENQSDFSDLYNILYGHNMQNGAMFGDVRKFLDFKYFSKHKKGFLQTREGNYHLTFFACMQADAYDSIIYQVIHDNGNEYDDLVNYLKENSDIFIKRPEHKIIALSTCHNYETFGRVVLLAEAEDTFEVPPEVKEKIIKRTAEGHEKDADHWALLNLICVFLTLLTLLPVTQIRKKYRQYRVAKKICEQLKHYSSVEKTMDYDEENEIQKIRKQLNFFLKKIWIGFGIEIVVFLLSIIVFLRTEDIHKRMILRDQWTGWMILIFAIALLVDFILFRYRGERPTQEWLDELTEE